MHMLTSVKRLAVWQQVIVGTAVYPCVLKEVKHHVVVLK